METPNPGLTPEQQKLVDAFNIDRPVPEHQGFRFGQRVRILEDDESAGIYADTEGVLIFETVGSPEYGNERVMFGYGEDGTDCAMEIRDPSIFEVVD